MTVRMAILITTQSGQAERQVEAFADIATAVRAEEGCLRYDLHRVTNRPDTFLLLEEWASEEALAAHDTSQLMAEAGARNAEFREGPVIVLELGEKPVA